MNLFTVGIGAAVLGAVGDFFTKGKMHVVSTIVLVGGVAILAYAIFSKGLHKAGL